MSNKIKSVSATNLKGSTFEQPLGDVTLFYGRNFAGKSTRVEALALALCGQLPGVAVRQGDVHTLLASGDELSVYAEAEDGRYSGRTWTKDRRGKYSLSAEGDLEAPALLFSTAEFLDLSPKERTRFLFRTLPPPPLDKVGPDAVVAQLKNVKCDPHTEAHEKAINHFTYQVHADYADYIPVQEWLETLVSTVAESTKEATASARTMRQTALGSAALRQDAPQLAAVEDAKRKAFDAHNAACVHESECLRWFSDAERAVQEAKTLVDSYHGEPAEDYAAPLRQEKLELEQFVAANQDARQPDTAATAATLAAAKQRLDTARQNEARAAQKLGEFSALECCPTCKAKAKGWKTEVLESLQTELRNARAEVGESEKPWQAAGDAHNVALDALASWRRTQDELRQKRQRLKEVEARLNRMAEEKVQNDKVREPAMKARELLPKLEADSKRLATDYQAAKDKTKLLKEDLDKAEAAHRAALADAAAARQVQQATEKAEELEAKAEVGNALRDLLHELLEKCVEMSVGPLVDLCNRLCYGILPHPLSFVDGEVAMRPLGPSHKSMSGTEKALLYAALSVGLAAQSPVRLVVLDELSRLDRGNKVKLVDRLCELAVAGEIDQAVLVDVEPLEGFAGREVLTQVEVRR